jgi:hypothetical protein
MNAFVGRKKNLVTMTMLAPPSAATPALAGGWYLMEPPPTCGWICDAQMWMAENGWRDKPDSAEPAGWIAKMRVDGQAPLRRWEQKGEYELLSRCQAARALKLDTERALAEHTSDDPTSKQLTELDNLTAHASRCIGTDDLRLAR